EPMTAKLDEMPDAEYSNWIRDVMNGANDGAGSVSEEVLIRLLSSAIRADDPRIRAELFVDLANKALAMADKTLGCQDLVTTTFTLRH
ncbi:hypothetical protein ABTK15_20180, partial [Acinetobacter baumannii]